MPLSAVDPPFDQCLETAAGAAREPPEVDLEIARGVPRGGDHAHNCLALNRLDELEPPRTGGIVQVVVPCIHAVCGYVRMAHVLLFVPR